MPFVAKVNQGVTRNEYRKKIASALMLEESVVDEEWRKFSAYRRQSTPQVVTKKLPEPVDPSIRKSGETILRMVWHDCDLAAYVTATVPLELFAKVHLEILMWLKKCSDDGRRPDDLNAAKELSEQAFKELSRILLRSVSEPETSDVKAFEDSINVFRRVVLKKKYAELTARAEEYMVSGNPEYRELLRESLKVKDEIDDLC